MRTLVVKVLRDIFITAHKFEELRLYIVDNRTQTCGATDESGT